MAAPLANRQYDKIESQWFVEPSWAVEALVNTERFCGEVYDPAAGGGTIPNVFRGRGFPAHGTDLADRGNGIPGGSDFLAMTVDHQVDNIVSNPPYDKAEAFVRKALAITRFKVAFILRLSFLESRRRRELFERTPLARVWVFSDRVSMPPGCRPDIEAKGGSVAYAWFVWDQDHRGPPALGWLAKPHPGAAPGYPAASSPPTAPAGDEPAGGFLGGV